MTELEITRNAAMPVWHWEIPVYLFLGGLTAGLMILGALFGGRAGASRAMRILPLAAPVVLSLGMLALFLDLELKLHVFRFYTAFRITAPMSWGSWILLLVYPATIALGIARIRGELPERFASRLARLEEPRTVRFLERANVVLGIALGAYTGILLATLSARALWSSALLGPLFLVSGFSTAAALAMLLPVTDGEHATVRRWDIAAVGVELALLALFFIHLAANGSRGREAAALFFGGSYTALFWSLVVIAGLALPLAIEFLETRRGLRPTWAAPLLLLAGGFALRWIFVAAGQSV
jgi:formate-dependent nitrite reductase membrane component NrfD